MDVVILAGRQPTYAAGEMERICMRSAVKARCPPDQYSTKQAELSKNRLKRSVVVVHLKYLSRPHQCCYRILPGGESEILPPKLRRLLRLAPTLTPAMN